MMNRPILIAVLILAVVAFAWLAMGRGATSERISGERARQLVSEGALLVDVRTRAEYQARHIPGATNVPLREIRSRTDELAPKDRPLVLYCHSGRRSAIATRRLESTGFEHVYDLGPMSAW